MNSYTDIDGVPAGADAGPADRTPARGAGASRARWSPTTSVHRLPAHHAPRRRHRRRGRRAAPSPRASTSNCPTPSATANRSPNAVRAGDRPRGPGRPGRTPRPAPEGRTRAARRRLHPGGSTSDGTDRPGPARPTAPWPASSPSRASSCSTTGTACCRSAAGHAGSPWSARAPTTPTPFSAATPSPTTSSPTTPATTTASRCPRLLDALATELPATPLISVRTGLPGQRTPTAPASTRRWRQPAGGRVRRRRRRPRRPVRPRHLGRGLRRRGPLDCRASRASCVEALLATGTPVVLVLVSGRPYALGAYADRARRRRPGLLPRRGGRPRAGRACSPGGSTPRAGCP